MRTGTSRGQDLSTWFDADTDIRRLGHVSGPPNRHFTAFVNPGALLRSEDPDPIVEALFSNVQDAISDSSARLDRQRDKSIPVVVWHVESEGNDAKIAAMVRKFLRTKRIEVADVTPIPRHYNGQEWEFPKRIRDLDRPIGVLIVQFWTINGSTLPEMVRLAGKSGASWIAAVCLLNQLSSNKADVLVMPRTVAGPVSNVADITQSNAKSSDVPVSTLFVASSGITAFNVDVCPICMTREKYSFPEDHMPGRLSSHAKDLRKLLRCREWQDVSSELAVDLFAVRVTGAETVDYLRWRGLLFRALRSLSDRQEVIERLRKLTDESPVQHEWTSVGLIRLLAAEQQWLRLPPLIFITASDLLAGICLGGLKQTSPNPWLRVQFVMVMASTRPDRLVELLPRLMSLAGNDLVLLDQMLLDCYRLLRGPVDSPINLTLLRQSLQTCRDDAENRLRESDASTMRDYLPVIRSLLAVADYRIIVKPASRQAAWERLREDLVRPVVRHELESVLLVVRSFVEDCELIKPSPEAALEALADWDICVQMLGQQALANLPPLREILAGDFFADRLGRQDQQQLLTLAAESGGGELQAVTDWLLTLSHGGWIPEDPSQQALRHELLDRINWWIRMFLAAHVGGQERPALLVDVIDSAPVVLSSCMDDLLVAHQAQATVMAWERGDKKVFCPKKLLDQVLTHLLENLDRHRAKDAEAPCRLEIEYLPQTADTLQMVMRNTGTTLSNRPGRGLQALNEKLQPFGGSLTPQALPKDEPGGLTFAVTITLPLWDGGRA